MNISEEAVASGKGTSPASVQGPWAFAIAGGVALAVAMGIGRFAFTPLLPMMLAERTLDLQDASWLASANYIGYLLGAVLCTLQPWIASRIPRLPPADGPSLVRGGLVATALLTAGMAIPLPALWPLLRFAAGVASAVVFVYASGFCLSQLAGRGVPALGGVIYVGPGAGIVLSGLLASAMVHLHWRASGGWVLFGLLSVALTAWVWQTFRSEPAPPVPIAARQGGGAVDLNAVHGRVEVGMLALAYGVAGFGYIITATFLPVIARAALPGSLWPSMFWPILGFGVMLGAMLATRVRMSGDMRLLLAGCYAMQAAGIGIGVLSPTVAGFAVSSLVIGTPFTVITFFAMQEVRRIRPVNSASYMGLVTAVYGIGQIVGPPLAALSVRHSASEAAGFTLALEIAMTALFIGGAMFLWMMRLYPMRRA